MSRQVRRVPMNWQHPMYWTKRWDRSVGESRMQLVPRPLYENYPAARDEWKGEKALLVARQGHSWEFGIEYYLTGYKGYDDAEATVHMFAVNDDETVRVKVRDEDHLQQLLLADHEARKPDPRDYMPTWKAAKATGWCMYETTSEGTPISPVFATPEELARWLADNNASTFGRHSTTYEHWLSMIQAGWAPTAGTDSNGRLAAGVDLIAKEGA